jgi:hypothetical protein
MMTFRETWEKVVELLQDNSSDLGVSSDDILPGIITFDADGRLKIPARKPPFIYVYAIPKESLLHESGSRLTRQAEIGILCAVKSEINTTEGIKNAVELAERVEVAIQTYPDFRSANPIVEIANPTPDNVRTIVGFEINYKSSVET